MFYSGLPICCGRTLAPANERLCRKGGMIDNDVVTGESRCPTCGNDWLYSRKPTTADFPPVSQKAGIRMFSPDTPLYLRGISPSTETVDDETRKILVLDFMAQPFTRAMADDLNIASDVFEGTTGNPNDVLVDAKLKINVPLQRMTFKMAPDAEGRIVIDDVQIGKTIKIRADKEGPVLTATISVTMRYPTGDDLLYILNGYCEQHFMTFENQQFALGLAEGDEKKPRPGRKKTAQAETVGA